MGVKQVVMQKGYGSQLQAVFGSAQCGLAQAIPGMQLEAGREWVWRSEAVRLLLSHPEYHE
jgi:hypothetical protein